VQCFSLCSASLLQFLRLYATTAAHLVNSVAYKLVSSCVYVCMCSAGTYDVGAAQYL
jgi:hypothetical protein